MKYGNGKLGGRIIETIRKKRTLFVCICAMVVFVTTYLLILPAITLDQDTAKDQGGIDLPKAEQVQEVDQEKDADRSSADVEAKGAAEDADKSASEDTAAGGLSYEGNGYTVEAAFDAKAGLPEDTSLEAVEIKSDDEDYDAWRDEALKAVQEAKGGEQVTDLKFAKFYDISLIADGQAIEPEAPVDISISYDKALKAADADHVRIIHFGADENGDLVPEVLDPDDVDLDLEKGKMSSTAFAAESFSVYGVVYTVDFHWEVNGEKLTYSLKGGDVLSLAKLAKTFGLAESYILSYDKKQDAANSKELELGKSNDDNEITKRFIAQIETVKFSDPDLIWVEKVTKDTATWKIMSENDLHPEYSYGTTEQEFCEIYNRIFEAPDWVLLPMKPFDTIETLTVTMKTGEVFEIVVTDAQDAPIIDDGQGGKIVQTINNPNGTTIDLFDYWITNGTRNNQGMDGWPGHQGNAFNSWEFDWYNYNGQRQYNVSPMAQDPDRNNDWYVQNGYLRGNGNNQGINNGHVLKFYPGAAGTVVDYGDKGWHWHGTGNAWTNNHDYYSSINSWTGSADPTVGLVQSSLNAQGYPQLTNNPSLGTDGSSLSYLFDDNNHAGKQKYGGVNNLLYVDPDGYYTYDSYYYSAQFNSDQKNFTLREHSTSAQQAQRGFWPFGDRVNWHGMHMTTEFSMPANGQVLNPKGEYKDMEFEFHGDDDTWLYIDGILVGDGGGIHNHTKININFKTGKVIVTGTDDPVADHIGTYTSERYLDEIFREALAAQGKTEAEINAYIAEKFDGHTFKQGSNHTFEMFYLERGGSESNLYIHYNLISTTDFSAHKSYHMLQGDPHARLERDQFKFELIGYDNMDLPSGFQRAIMPDNGTTDGAGTYASPQKVYHAPTADSEGYTSLITGVTEDGNVNFGNVQVQESQAGMTYRYMVRELVDPDAENADGVKWRNATEEQKAEGGFVDANGVTYDNKVYYFTGTVQETSPGSGQYELKKTRYTDETYKVVDTETKFFSFVNGHVEPITLKVLKKSDQGDRPLNGAQFSFTKATLNVTKDDGGTVISSNWVPKDGAVPRTGTTSDGVLSFNNLREGHYILEETAAPDGYEPGEISKWLVTITKVEETDKIVLIPTITPLNDDGSVAGEESEPIDVDDQNTFQYEVLNGKPPINISVEKQWYDNGDSTPPEGASATFELHRVKNVSPVTVELLDVQGEKISEVQAYVGDTIKIYGSGENGFVHHSDQPNNWTVMMNNGRYEQTISDSISPRDGSGWTISTVTTYRGGGDFFNYNVWQAGQTTSSTGQYTVKDTDISGGKVQLRLNGHTKGAFDKLPILYNETSSSVGPTDEVLETFTLPQDGDSDNSWKKTFEDLPSIDEDGNDYRYYVIETSHTPAAYDHQSTTGDPGTADAPLSGSSDVIFTNSTAELQKITASKVWKDKDGNVIDANSGLDGLEVKLTLYKGDNPAPADDVKGGADKITQIVTGDGTASWFLLDEHGDVTQYSVRETAVKIPGGDFVDVTSENPFGGTVTGDSTNGYTVTNQLPETEISVTKEWKDGTSANADKVFDDAKTINFTLYQILGNNDGAVYPNEDEPVTGTVTYTPASGGTAASWSTEAISNLPVYVYKDGRWLEAVYYPVESEINGVTIAYQKAGETATETPADAAVSSGTVTIINTDIVAPIRIVKIDKDTEAGLTGAKFQLTRKLPGESSFTKFEHSSFEEDADNENKKTGPFTVSSTDGIILEGLLPGEYRIEEKEVPAGYINSLQPFTFTVSSDGEVTIPSDADSTLVWHLDKNGDNPEGLKIGNTPGEPLPSAGGPGTTWIYLIGSILLICCSTLLVARRRTRRES